MATRYVQACITAVSFPDTPEELANRVVANRDVPGALTDIDCLELFHPDDRIGWTAPRWMTQGDILFFYHTASARTNIARLQRHLDTLGRVPPSFRRALERAHAQAKAYSRSIFACAQVAGRPYWGGSPADDRHFRSTIFAPLRRVQVFRTPLPSSAFSRVLTLSTGGTLTAVHGRSLTKLKQLLRRQNSLPRFLQESRPSLHGFRGVTSTTWPRVAASTAAFIDESQVRAYLIDYLLEDVKDRGTAVFEECRCSYRGKGTGRADYFLRVHDRWIPAEAKLSIQSERDLLGQLRKYVRIDGFFPGRVDPAAAPVAAAPCGLALIVDSDGVYLVNKGKYVGRGPGHPTWPRRTLSHRTGAQIRAKIAHLLDAV